MVGLIGAERKLPGEISGGMRKRAGLARALVLEPEIILCDEPDSGLDPVRTAYLNQLIVDLNAADRRDVPHRHPRHQHRPYGPGQHRPAVPPRAGRCSARASMLPSSTEPVVRQFLNAAQGRPDRHVGGEGRLRAGGRGAHGPRPGRAAAHPAAADDRRRPPPARPARAGRVAARQRHHRARGSFIDENGQNRRLSHVRPDAGDGDPAPRRRRRAGAHPGRGRSRQRNTGRDRASPGRALRSVRRGDRSAGRRQRGGARPRRRSQAPAARGLSRRDRHRPWRRDAPACARAAPTPRPSRRSRSPIQKRPSSAVAPSCWAAPKPPHAARKP